MSNKLNTYDFQPQNLSKIFTIVYFSLLYMTLMIANMIMTNRHIALGSMYVFGGAFISPFLFILGDIIAELYGYKFSKGLIFGAFGCQTFFVIMVKSVMMTRAPESWHHHAEFEYVLGSIARIHFSSLIAFIVSSLINAYTITKWKMLLKGRRFWLRSLGASTFAEGLYSGFAIVMIAFDKIPSHELYHVILLTYLIKIGCSITFAYPANIVVNIFKYVREKQGANVEEQTLDIKGNAA